MSKEGNKALTDALLARLKKIEHGQVAATARRGGMVHRHLTRLREGKNLDVSLSTFVRLAQGLGVPPPDLLAELLGGDAVNITPAAKVPASAARRKAIERVRARLLRAADAADSTGKALREVLRELTEE